MYIQMETDCDCVGDHEIEFGRAEAKIGNSYGAVFFIVCSNCQYELGHITLDHPTFSDKLIAVLKTLSDTRKVCRR